MSDRRRQEIELKRAKLAQLKEARENRKKQAGRSGGSTPGLASDSDSKRDEERTRVNALLNNLLGDSHVRTREGTSRGSSIPSTPAPAQLPLGGGSLGLTNNGGRSNTSRLSDSGSEGRPTRHNTMIQVGGDAPDRHVYSSKIKLPYS